MAFGDFVQIDTNFANSTSVVVTLTSSPTAGNLLVGCHFNRHDNVQGGTAPTDDTSDTFTQVVIIDDAGSGDDFGMYYKVSDGDESTVEFTGGGSDYQTACVVELLGTGGFASPALKAYGAGDAGGSTSTAGYCGVATPPAGNWIAVAGLSGRGADADWISSWSNSFVQRLEYHEAGYDNALGIATLAGSGGGNVTTTATKDDIISIGAIAIFEQAPVAGGSRRIMTISQIPKLLPLMLMVGAIKNPKLKRREFLNMMKWFK